MYKILFIFFVLITSISCNNTDYVMVEALKNRVTALQVENDSLKNQIVILKRTPAVILKEIERFDLIGLNQKALNEINMINELYPNSDEAKKAMQIKIKVQRKIDTEIAEEKEKNLLGFAGLKNTNSFESLFNKLKLRNIKTSNNWVIDRYSDRYFSIPSERDRKIINFDVDITSSSKTPLLPAFYIYKVVDDHLEYVTLMSYEFYRWRDYGAYLGNYHDQNNDFSYSSTVKFTVGASVNKDLLSQNWVILAKNDICFERENNNYRTPTVFYQNTCTATKNLYLKDFDSDYIMIRKFNF